MCLVGTGFNDLNRIVFLGAFVGKISGEEPSTYLHSETERLPWPSRNTQGEIKIFYVLPQKLNFLCKDIWRLNLSKISWGFSLITPSGLHNKISLRVKVSIPDPRWPRRVLLVSLLQHNWCSDWITSSRLQKLYNHPFTKIRCRRKETIKI